MRVHDDVVFKLQLRTGAVVRTRSIRMFRPVVELLALGSNVGALRDDRHTVITRLGRLHLIARAAVRVVGKGEMLDKLLHAPLGIKHRVLVEGHNFARKILGPCCVDPQLERT